MKVVKKVLLGFIITVLIGGGMAAALPGVTATDSPPNTISNVEIIKPGMEWHYLDDHSDPNVGTWYEEWNKRNGWAYPLDFLDWGTIPMRFDDENWPRALDKGVFSFDANANGGFQLNKKEDGKAGSTYFFRHTFELDKPEDIVAITGKVRYNDAIILYLNGKPVENLFNIPISNYSKNLEYGASERITDKYVEEDFVIQDVSNLYQGLNTIAIELHTYDENENDAYLDLMSFVLNPAKEDLPATDAVKNIAVNTGEDESKVNFAWYSLSGEIGKVQIAKSSDKVGNDFPVDKAVTFDAADRGLAYTKFYDKNYYYNKVTVSDLEQGTDYIYRVGNDAAWSDSHILKTQDINEGYEVLFLSDAQVGTGTIPTDKAGWQNTLNKAFEKYPNISFIANTGDMVDVATKENEYDAYFSPEALLNVPSATAVGNHDISANYGYHYNEPNLSGLGANEANSDYYFTYGNILYLVLNTNNTNNKEHIEFIEKTMAEMSDREFDWSVLMFHQSIYSAAKQSTIADNIQRREELVPVIDKFGFDVVLMGHDHCYVRTHHLKGLDEETQVLPVKEIDQDGYEINPDGTLYLTTSSASGSKYYDLVGDYSYSVIQEQLYVPTFSRLTFTKDSFTMTAHRSDTMEVIDSYKMKKVKDDVIVDKDPEVDNKQEETNSKPVVDTPSKTPAVKTGDETSLAAWTGSMIAVSAVYLGLKRKRG